MIQGRPLRNAVALSLAVCAASVALTGCSGSGGPSADNPSSGVTATRAAKTGQTIVVRGLRLSGGYVPQPASPDVASAYLTINNTTAQPVTLLRAVTNVTKTVMAMDEKDAGGVGSMTDLSSVAIAAHGVYRFTPNHAHLMLEQPSKLIAGDRVNMTLIFSRLGTVTYTLPVVPLGQTPEEAPSSYRSVVPSTPGMTMSHD